MTRIDRVEAFAVSLDHHYKVAGRDHRPGGFPGTPYYLEPAWAQVYSTRTMTCLLKLTDSDGRVAWGETQAPIAPAVVVTLVEDLLGPALLGRDADDPAAERDRLAGLMAVRGHHAGFFADAVAGLDIALWDLRARREGLPLATVLGGDVTRELPLYVSGLRRPTTAERVERARELAAEGYRGFKMFLSGTVADMAADVRAVRDGVGADAVLMVDLLWGQALADATALARELEPLGVRFLECPLRLVPVEDHAVLAAATSVPVAAGEHAHTVAEAVELVRHGVRVVQPDVARTGVTEGLRIAEAVRAAGGDVTWHVGTCSPVASAKSWAMATTAPTDLLQEHQGDLGAADDRVVHEPLPVVDGCGRLPQVPGTGVDVDEDAVRASSTRSCDVRLPG